MSARSVPTVLRAGLLAVAAVCTVGIASCSLGGDGGGHEAQLRPVAEAVPAPVGGRWVEEGSSPACGSDASSNDVAPYLHFTSAPLAEGADAYLRRLADLARRRGRRPELAGTDVTWLVDGDITVRVEAVPGTEPGGAGTAAMTVSGPPDWCR